MPHIASIIYKEYAVSLYCRDLFLVLCRVVSCRVAVSCWVVLIFRVFSSTVLCLVWIVSSRLVSSCLVLCLVFSYFSVLSCLASSCLVLSCLVLCCVVLSCRAVSCLLKSYRYLVFSRVSLGSFSSRHVLRDACSSKTCYTRCAWRGASG
jgi:hypothetical protein